MSGGKQLTRGPYLTLKKDQKLVIAQRVVEHGTTTAIRFFANKYPKLPLKKGKDKLYEQPGAAPSAHIFDGKKTGRPLMIGKESDKQVQDYITYMCSTGTTVNTTVCRRNFIA